MRTLCAIYCCASWSTKLIVRINREVSTRFPYAPWSLQDGNVSVVETTLSLKGKFNLSEDALLPHQMDGDSYQWAFIMYPTRAATIGIVKQGRGFFLLSTQLTWHCFDNFSIKGMSLSFNISAVLAVDRPKYEQRGSRSLSSTRKLIAGFYNWLILPYFLLSGLNAYTNLPMIHTRAPTRPVMSMVYDASRNSGMKGQKIWSQKTTDELI